jgi:hypothetical protein
LIVFGSARVLGHCVPPGDGDCRFSVTGFTAENGKRGFRFFQAGRRSIYQRVVFIYGAVILYPALGEIKHAAAGPRAKYLRVMNAALTPYVFEPPRLGGGRLE